MKALHALFLAGNIALSASAQTPPPAPDNWGPVTDGVRVSLSLNKLTYAVGENIPLHIAAQVISAKHPVYGIADRPQGAFFNDLNFSRAFHLTITDEHGQRVGYDGPANLALVGNGSSGPYVCPTSLNVGHVYTLEQSASSRSGLLPTQPGTYRLTVTWSPYPPSDPPCVKSHEPSFSEEFQPFVSVSSPTLTIHITGN